MPGRTARLVTDLCVKRAASCQKELNAAGRAVCHSESHELLTSGQVPETFWLAQLAANIPTVWISCNFDKEGKKEERNSDLQKGKE